MNLGCPDALLAALGFLALGAMPAEPRSPLGGGTEKKFEEALRVVDRTIASGKGKRAKELLLATIETSRDQPWALYHLTEIEDNLRRATFWSSMERPDPKDLVSGELLSWSPASGQIKLRYKLRPESEDARGKNRGSGAAKGPGPLADFTRQGSLWVHPIAFDGPFTIEIQGASYPAFSDPPRAPTIAVCAGWSRSTLVAFGLQAEPSNQGRRHVPARIVQVEGGESTTEAQGDPEIRPGQSYSAKVAVTPSSVTAYVNDDKILAATRSGPLDGRFAFENFPGEIEISVAGKAQPSWLQNLVDTAIQERWTAFEKGYRAVDDLPAWLRGKAAGTGVPSPGAKALLPGKDSSRGLDHVEVFATLIREGNYEAALDCVERIPAGDVAEEVRGWLCAQALSGLGRDRDALDACARVCALDSDFLPARRMKVGLQADVAGLRPAIEDGVRTVADFPKESGPCLDLATLYLLAGRPEEARALVRSAIDAGIPALELQEAGRLVTRALRGPLWSKSYEYKSEHYTIASDISQQVCFEAASLLEKSYTKFNLHLRRVPAQEKRVFRVYLFSGRAGYEAYTRDLVGHAKEGTAGLYYPVVKQLLIWNVPDFENMMRTVRHEGFHQYLDRLVGDAPIWLNEGLAEYYEGSRLVKGSWSDGEVQIGHVELLREKGFLPLREFVRIRPSAFYEPKAVHAAYAQSWALVHFLLNSGAENREVFDRVLDALIAGARPIGAVEKTFTEPVLARLEPEFARYVRQLR